MAGFRRVRLADLRAGDQARVIEIIAGCGLAGRLEALGIRPGTAVKKVSSLFLRGPVTVEVRGTRVAMGFGMAQKILVETEEAGSGGGSV